MLFREIRVGGVCDLIEPGAGVVLIQFEQGVHYILCGVQGRLIEGTVVHVQHLRNLAEQLFFRSAGVAFVLCDADVCAFLLKPDGNAQFFLGHTSEVAGTFDAVTDCHAIAS